jgi:glycosyltransferase involved in cell wall biosynthesis
MELSVAKIVHLTSAHPAFDVRIFHRECKTLIRAGYRVTLIAPHACDENSQGIIIKGFPKRRTRLGRFTCSVWRVCQTAISEKGTIYHFHDPDLIPVGLVLRLLGKKVIYDVHEYLPKDILSKSYIPYRLRRLVAGFADHVERWSSLRFSGVVSATPAIGKRFCGINQNSIVAQNFPALGEFSPELDDRGRKPWVAYAGVIAERRGITTMVEAMGMLPSDLNATLELAGMFESTRDYERVRHLPGWDRVHLRGMLKRAGVRELLAAAGIGLVVYQPAPNHDEAGPHKFFEYMAAGIPIIASDFPHWRRMIEGAGCGIVVDPVRPSETARAIEFLLTHPAEAAKMGKHGRAAFERHYNWEAEETKLLQLYESILNGRVSE